MTPNFTSQIRRWLLEIALLLAAIAFAMLLSWARGQDANWDLLNYHLYNAWALLSHAPYHFAASIQGYFDPYLDVPYYVLATDLLAQHPQILQALAGIPYGVLLFEIGLLARLVVAELALERTWQRVLLIAWMVVLAGTGVSIWIQVGTTTNEITVAAVVMAGVLLLAQGAGLQESSRRTLLRTALVGAALGLATGLKLTAGVYLPAAGVYYLLSGGTAMQRVRRAAVYSSAALAMAALSYGPWGWHLYQTTGNPFFPMFNDIFHSPLAAIASTGRDVRFIPKDWLQWIFYPFYWLDSGRSTVYEYPFRDARYALFFVILTSFLIAGLASRARKRPPPRLQALLVFAVAAYVVWLAMFSILRYSIVIEIVMSVAALTMLQLLLPCAWRVVRLAVAGVVVLAIVSYGKSTVLPSVAYARSTFQTTPINLPSDALVLLANQPMGILAPLLAQQHANLAFAGIPSAFGAGGWMNRDFYSYGVGRSLRQLLRVHSNHLYAAYYVDRVPVFAGLQAFGIGVDFDRCQNLTTNITPDVRICQAWLNKEAASAAPRSFRLVADVSARATSVLHVAWLDNPCSASTSYGRARFAWHAKEQAGATRLEVQTHPGAGALFAAGGATGDAETGHWVRAGQVFTLRSDVGVVLASAHIRYIPCKEAAKP